MLDGKYIRLGELAGIELGKTPARGSPRFWDAEKDTNNVWLSIADMPIGLHAVASDSKEYLSDLGYQECKVVPKGTLLVSFKLTLGRLVYAGRDLCTNEAIAALYIKDEAFLNKEYLYWYLTYFDWHKAAEGDVKVKGKTLNKAKLKEILIFVPNMEEQKRIVAILDEAFAGIDQAIANTEQNIQNARELFESYLNTIFTQKGEGWEEFEIKDVCDSIVDCINRTAPITEEPTEFKMIRTPNIRNGRISLEKVRCVSEETYKTWTRRQVPQKGDVLLTREAPLGEVGIVDFDDSVFLGQRIVSYRANPDLLDPAFLLFSFQSKYMQTQIHSNGSGATVQHMRVPDSKVLKLWLPSVEQQRVLSRQLQEVQRKCDLLFKQSEQKLTALKELKQSLLQKAFAGELTVDLSEAA